MITIKHIKVIGVGILVVFLCVLLKDAIVSHITKEREGAKRRLKVMDLQYMMPSFVALVAFSKGRKEKLGPHDFKSYADYYEEIVEVAPDNADAHNMLGFCYYHLGSHHQAATSYKKAIELNPHFFWSHYNLGVIYFKKGLYKGAAESLAKAVATKPTITLKVIYTSRIYGLMRDSEGKFDLDIASRLKDGYRKGYILLKTLRKTELLKDLLPEEYDFDIRFF